MDFNHKLEVKGSRSEATYSECKSKSEPVSSATLSCPFSGIRIASAKVTANELQARMISRTFVRLSMIKQKINKKTNDVEGDWATIAVITDKFPVRKTKTGNDFSMWKLNDLRTLETSVVLMMFGQAHGSHWKLQKGTVVGLVNPKVMPNKDNKGELTISIDNGTRLLELGTAVDFGQCRASKKNGDICNALINTTQGLHCLFHIRLDYQKIQSARPELQSVFSGVQPKNSPMERMLRESMATNSMASAKDASKVDKQLLLDQYQSRKQLEAESLNKHLNSANHSVAAQQLLKVRAASNGETVMTNPLMQDQTQAKGLLARTEAAQKMPILGRGLRVGEHVDLIAAKKVNGSILAKRKAIAMVRERALQRQNPNSVKPRTNSALDQILARVDANLDADEEEINLRRKDTDQDPNGIWLNRAKNNRKRKRAEEEEEAKKRKMEAIEAIMNQKSSHEHQVKAIDQQAMDKYFNVMEQKETLDERMTGVEELKVDVVFCKSCAYVAQSQSDLCRNKNHQIIRKKATKRFFRCRECRTRTYTFDQMLPVRRCQCGSDRFERVGMKDERHVKLDNEKLMLRGEERKFLNTLH
jgi:minichromosome maintenance protein 10